MSPNRTAGLPDRRDWLICGALALAAFAFRLALIFVWQTYKHDASYIAWWYGAETGAVAKSIAEGHGFASPFGGSTGPTAWISPVYAYLCAAVFKISGVFTDNSAKLILTLNSVFSALTCFPMLALGKRLFSRPVAFLATAVWSLVPFFMRWPTTWFWDMSLSAFCVTLICLLAFRTVEQPSRARWSWLGLANGISLLVNPALLTVVVVAFIWLLISLRRDLHPHFLNIGLSFLLAVAATSPWMIRNVVVFGRPVFLRSNFGFEFHLGNYHYSNGMGWDGRHPMKNARERDRYARLGELAYVREHSTAALDFVRHCPAEFLKLTADRAVWFWDGTYLLYTSAEPWTPWMYASLSVLAALGAWLAIRNRIRGALWLTSTCLIYPLPYYLTYTQTRYRHAIEPILLIFMGFLFDVVWCCVPKAQEGARDTAL